MFKTANQLSSCWTELSSELPEACCGRSTLMPLDTLGYRITAVGQLFLMRGSPVVIVMK